MTVSEAGALNLVYEGSVKRVLEPAGMPDCLWFEFTDDYSVFDWGKMPDTIAGKGRALALLGSFFFNTLADPTFWQGLPQAPALERFDAAWLAERWRHPAFQRLSRQGADHHFSGLRTASGDELSLQEAARSPGAVYMEVLAARVARPRPMTLLGQTVYDYPRAPAQPRLVPLEVVFRFGMPEGSSLKERLEREPQYAQVLGLKTLKPGDSWFDRPVVELFTKLEPKDRLLSVQEALLISGLGGQQFEELSELALDLALALYVIFGRKGIELWDGKFEFVLSGDRLLLADSIGPDELRLLYKGCHLSKEMIRQVYRGTPWECSLKQAQSLARERREHDWKTICTQELKSFPEPLPREFKELADQLYRVLANHIGGERLFDGLPTLDEFVEAVARFKQRKK